MPVEWFTRVSDVPGFDYEPPAPIDRTKLSGHDAVPEQHRSEFGGRAHESLWWSYRKGEGTSASPAQNAAFGEGDDRELPTSAVLRRLWESLELPGTASDYHLAIQGAGAAMTSRRRSDPQAIGWFEHLCWLDIRLIQAAPDAVRDEYRDAQPERGEFYDVSAFGGLIGLYCREGFLQEAMEVAQVADRFGQGQALLADLEQRFAALRAEDGG